MGFIARLAVAAACGAFVAHAWGQPAKNAARDYPDKPVRWVVPFTPGASNDVIARLIAAKLLDAWGAAVHHRQPSGRRRPDRRRHGRQGGA